MLEIWGNPEERVHLSIMCVNTVGISRVFCLFRSLLHKPKNITLTFKALQCSSFSNIYCPIFFCFLLAYVLQGQNPTVHVRAGRCRLTSICCFWVHAAFCVHLRTVRPGSNQLPVSVQSILPESTPPLRGMMYSGCWLLRVNWMDQLLITGLYDEAYVSVGKGFTEHCAGHRNMSPTPANMITERWFSMSWSWCSCSYSHTADQIHWDGRGAETHILIALSIKRAIILHICSCKRAENAWDTLTTVMEVFRELIMSSKVIPN